MKILYDLQLSVLDNLRDGNFIIDRDSNLNVANTFIKNFLKKYEDSYFYVLVPNKDKIIKEENGLYDLFLKNKNIEILEYNYFGNPFVDRITFDSKRMKDILKEVDIIYTNDPSKVLSYKTIYYYLFNKFVPVISRNHWVTGSLDRKVPEEIDFVLRQYEGAYKGDLMTFNSNFAIEFFLESITKEFGETLAKKIEDKLFAIEFVDIDKVNSYMKNKEIRDKFVILFAHRLSYYTGWKETLDALKELYNRRKDFIVFVPDPGNKFKQEDLKKEYEFIQEIDKSKWTHKDYMHLCWEADFAIGNHKYPATWGGLSLTEPMAAYTVPIIPRRHAYLEMFYKNEEYVFFKDEKDMIEKIDYLMNNRIFLERYKRLARTFCEKFLNPEKFVDFYYKRSKLLIKKYARYYRGN